MKAVSPVAASTTTTTGVERWKTAPFHRPPRDRSVSTIARRPPSGLNSVPCAVCVAHHTSRPDVTSNMRTTSSCGHYAATRLPSGLNDGPHTSPPAGNSNSARSSPVAGSQRRRALSSPVVASSEPSALKATSLMPKS